MACGGENSRDFRLQECTRVVLLVASLLDQGEEYLEAVGLVSLYPLRVCFGENAVGGVFIH